MSPEEQAEAEAQEVGKLDELWSRRLRVQTLRLRGFTQEQIARTLEVNQSTVSRDMEWIRKNRNEQFGMPSKFDAADEIGEAVALFRDVEMQSLRDYARLPTTQIKDRTACLRSAMFARMSRLNVLMDHGILERQIGTVGVALRADAVRASLLKEGLLLPEGRRDPSLDVLGESDPFDAWLRRA